MSNSSTLTKCVMRSGETSGPQRVVRHTGIFVVNGALSLYVGEKKQVCGAGACINLSQNTPHVFRNEGSSDLVYIRITAPLPKGVDPIKGQNRVTVRSANNADCVGVVGDTYALLMEGEDTDKSYAAVEGLIGPGGGPPPHIHTREVEAFYILNGDVDFMVSSKQMRLSAGQIVEVPIGTLHTFKNNSASSARMLIVTAPSGLEKMFREVGRKMSSSSELPPPPTPEEIGKLVGAAARYGIELKIPH